MYVEDRELLLRNKKFVMWKLRERPFDSEGGADIFGK